MLPVILHDQIPDMLMRSEAALKCPFGMSLKTVNRDVINIHTKRSGDVFRFRCMKNGIRIGRNESDMVKFHANNIQMMVAKSSCIAKYQITNLDVCYNVIEIHTLKTGFEIFHFYDIVTTDIDATKQG
jgi:hypothetical protein